MQNHIIICGLGNVGFRTFEILAAAKQNIVIVSDKVHDELRWKVEKAGGVFLLGDARNDSLLIAAGIKEAKAIIAVTDQDVVNATVAIDAKTLNPHIKIIIRMIDPEVGNHLSKALGIKHVFSPSEIASPIFAKSILHHSTLAQFVLDDKVYLISDKKIQHNNQDFTQNKMENDILLTTDSHQLVVNPAEKFKEKKHRWFPYLRKLNYLRSPVFAHFRLFLFILLCVILCATLFLKWAIPLPFTDALYFVTTTVTTVGYGDYNFLHSPPALKLFGCLLMLSGAAAIAILFSSITEIILSQKLPSVLGGLPVPKKNHVIVVGAGLIGHKIVSTLLKDQIPIVIMENDPANHYSADINRQVALVEGFLSSRITLSSANVKTAKAILVITDDDVNNLSISLAAKKMNAKIINIIQVFNDKLARQMEATLSINRVLSVSNIVAPYFAAAVFADEILVALKWHNQLIFVTKDKEHAGNSEELHQNIEIKKACISLNEQVYSDICVQSISLS